MNNTQFFFISYLFLSFLCVQINNKTTFSGLFGDEGILPARLLLEGKAHPLNFFNHPTLQHFSSFLGGDVTCTLDFIAIVGSMIALAGLVSLFTGALDTRKLTFPFFSALSLKSSASF